MNEVNRTFFRENILVRLRTPFSTGGQFTRVRNFYQFFGFGSGDDFIFCQYVLIGVLYGHDFVTDVND